MRLPRPLRRRQRPPATPAASQRHRGRAEPRSDRQGLLPGRTVQVYYPYLAARPITKSWVSMPAARLSAVIRQATTPCPGLFGRSSGMHLLGAASSWTLKAASSVFFPLRLRPPLSYQLVTRTAYGTGNVKHAALSIPSSSMPLTSPDFQSRISGTLCFPPIAECLSKHSGRSMQNFPV